MKTNVKQWGNSIAVRIPQIFAKEIGIMDGTTIEINLINKQIILSNPKLSLNDLLNKVTSKNIHQETSTGSIHGKEIW